MKASAGAQEFKQIFEYDNYRTYLRDYYTYAKSTSAKFSFRYFSKLAGFKSGTVLKQVIDGQSNIAPLSIPKFAHALKLNKEESAFFRHLVLFNQATNSSERQAHAAELLKFRRYRETHPLSTAQLDYLRNWYFVPVRELVSLKGFREDPNWIASKIHPPIKPSEATKALTELCELGLLTRDESGRLRQAHGNVSTGDEVVSAFAADWHREMLKKASESIERDRRELRDISAITVSVSDASMKTIKEMVQRFRKEVMAVASRESTPDQIYQMNFQIFPLSKKTEDGETK